MIDNFKNIFEGLDRAHGVTLVGESNGDGNKIKGKSFVKREPVTDDLWQKHLDGKDSFCVLYTSPSPRDIRRSRMPSSA